MNLSKKGVKTDQNDPLSVANVEYVKTTKADLVKQKTATKIIIRLFLSIIFYVK